MFKLIKRLLIILVIVIIAFIIFRYINPDGADKILGKIKSIPTTVSSWFSKDKSSINTISQTTIITGDFQTESIGDTSNFDDDKLWLETLNKEIESILGQDKKDDTPSESFTQTGKEENKNYGAEDLYDIYVDSFGNDDIVESNSLLINGKNMFIENDGVVVSNKLDTDVVDNNGTITIENSNNNLTSSITNNPIPNKNTTSSKTENKLTNFDYQQIKNVFGNLFK